MARDMFLGKASIGRGKSRGELQADKQRIAGSYLPLQQQGGDGKSHLLSPPRLQNLRSA